MRDGVARRLDEMGRQLEEMVDDNTTFVTELRRLERAQRESAAAVEQAVATLRGEIEDGLAHTAVRDVCLALIGPLTAMEASAGVRDPEVAAGHLRGVVITLRGVLTRMGAAVLPVVPGRDVYDPERHRCVAVLAPAASPFPDAPPHTVVRIVEDGYLLRGRPLVPAQVEIQAGPQSPASSS
jgi:molecular chaperone GrpE (heat shock protein)